MKIVKYLKLAGLALVLLSNLACGKSNQSNASPDSAKQGSRNRKLPSITIDGVVLNVEIVQDVEARQQGLMHRDDLPMDEGMLFVFETTRILSFWMRNTFIPLDIAFITEDGEVVDIQRMEPLNESKSYISTKPALYALEVNAGWFEKNGVKAGSRVVFE